MVAASKMKKAQDAALAGRPYSEELKKLIENIIQRSGQIEHPFFIKKDQPKKILLIFFTADRGLCGAFNSNVARYLIKREMAENQTRALIAVGRRGMQFAKHFGENVIAEFEGLSDNPEFIATAPITRLALDEFLSSDFDEVRLIYNHFVNTMSQELTEKVLLPLTTPIPKNTEEEKFSEIEYLFEPNPKIVFDKILPRYLETIVFQSLLESNASEQSARMVAMKSASENASELMDTLTLELNKARQASITTEILEIVGGAEALAEN